MQFQPSYFSAMDRGYYAPATPYDSTGAAAPNIEEPIIPLSELGETVVEKDPRTGANILQTMTAAIRAGAGTVQLVMTTPPDSAIGGRAKAYGHEVREAIRELALANEVHITGVELPTAISNLSGYNQQSGTISDEARFQALNEVRDAIRFVADVAQGGGVDIFSVEYPRTAFDAQWNEIEGYDNKGNPIFRFQMYPEEHERAVKHLVDDRNGRVIQEIRMNQEINYPVWNRYKGDKPYTDKKGHTVKKGDYIGLDKQWVAREERIPEYDSGERKFKVEKKTWHDFEDEADEINRDRARKLGKPVEKLEPNEKVTPQEAFLQASTESQERIARGYEMYYGQMVDINIEQRERLIKAIEFYEKIDENLSETEKIRMMQANPHFQSYGVLPPVMQKMDAFLKDELFRINRNIEQTQATMVGQRQQAEDLKLQREHITTAEKYAKEKSIQSYAEAGLYAFDETRSNKNVKRPLYVGPEIGWPQGFGAHPDEFIELIKTAREKMAQRLVEERNMGKSAAEQAAKVHIKGLFDTSHMGMWLNNFRRVPGESEDKRMKAFNSWYMEAVDKIAKADVIGQIQAVDSMSGAHGHLPAGQGIFPVVDAVKLFKKHGFKGPVVSEGHEEEQFGQNRILLETWKAFGAGNFRGSGGGPSLPGSWKGTQFGYFGRTYPPYFVYGGYAPSNEWTLWSQTPFE